MYRSLFSVSFSLYLSPDSRLGSLITRFLPSFLSPFHASLWEKIFLVGYDLISKQNEILEFDILCNQAILEIKMIRIFIFSSLYVNV